MSAPHIVTIKHDAESHEFDCHDDCTATLSCPGVTSSCRCWWECDACREAQQGMTDEQREDYDSDLWETSEAHGVEHQHIDGMWMVPTNDCVTQEMEHDAGYLVSELPDGEHPVSIDCEESFVYVTHTPATQSGAPQ